MSGELFSFVGPISLTLLCNHGANFFPLFQTNLINKKKVRLEPVYPMYPVVSLPTLSFSGDRSLK
uniref:Uncharacterized protein n=1 Tax=Utricularia reniformis TaxID=192314 RepID=A0A1Y0B4V9_9LAMI|nr:hypothetical protein AEK19_MT2282 [Utricularia reniformis]ART32427.1 hypothetical protein AEK19_MT2282 [Utricularia reniformis]